MAHDPARDAHRLRRAGAAWRDIANNVGYVSGRAGLRTGPALTSCDEFLGSLWRNAGREGGERLSPPPSRLTAPIACCCAGAG
jgi:hypothetical protein